MEAVEIGLATLPLPGQAECGDRHVVCAARKGVLLAVLDGLGHGREAAAAAALAAQTLERYAEESLIPMLERCHERLRETRGVVMSLARFNTAEGTMTWLGVGNVEGVLRRADSAANPPREVLLQRRGVVGGQMPEPYASIVPVTRGDILVFATDGVRNGFADDLPWKSPPQQIADRILALHAKRTDDALVLVARYLGADTP